jgi:8-oxo-dGTP diphosphatase
MIAPDGADSVLLFVVAAALIRDDGRILIQQRPAAKQHGGLWEFPGGKIEAAETPEVALARELREELGIQVDSADLLPLAFASEPAGARHLVLLLFRARRWAGEPRALDAAAIRWAAPGDLRALAMPPADLPFVAVLERMALATNQQG